MKQLKVAFLILILVAPIAIGSYAAFDEDVCEIALSELQEEEETDESNAEHIQFSLFLHSASAGGSYIESFVYAESSLFKIEARTYHDIKLEISTPPPEIG